MIEYIIEDRHYMLSYQELKEHYNKFKNMSDADFKSNIVDVLHLICIVGYLKEVPSHVLLCDIGLIHEIVHLMKGEQEYGVNFKSIRAMFNQWMELS